MAEIDDDLRTAIQDYLVDLRGCEAGKSEDIAEGLIDYLSERGWVVVDEIHQANKERHLQDQSKAIKKDCSATTEQS